jgi:O-antigen/teichoic acid export membrane protein
LSDRTKVVKDCAQYSAATVIGQGVGMIRAVIIPVLLSPAQLGVWNLMSVVMNYGGNAHLGILDGMCKLIPTLRGQGKLAEVEKIKDSVFWINAFLSAGWCAFILIASYAVSSDYATALRITALIVFLLGLFYYSFSLLRADNRFRLISIGVGGLSILSTVLILILGYFSPDRLAGALIGLAAAYGLVVLFWFLAGRYHHAFRIDGLALRRSFFTGAPLLIIGVLASLFLSIDRWMIASYMGATMLGYYALSIMLSNLIGLIPGSIASVLYPKWLERFGATGNPTALKGLFVGPVRVVVAFMSLLIGGAVLILPFLIKFLLPKYLPSVPLFGILIPAAFFYAAASIPGSFMVSINRQRSLIAIQIAAIILALAIDFVVVKMGWGIVGIAWGTAFAYAVYGGGYMFTAAYYAFDSRVDMAHFLVDVYLVFAAMILGLILVMYFIPEGVDMGTAVAFTVLRLTCFLIVLLPMLWWLSRHGDLFSIAREMFPAYFNKSCGKTL